MKLTIKELVIATNGSLLCGNDTDIINNVVIDSRKAKLGDVFIAIIGENLDGHKFINSAYENGCKTFIKNKSNSIKLQFQDINLIEVEDTTFALAHIAKYYKSKFEIPFIGVTGSVGKTTTKDMIFATLSNKLNTLKNEGNFNNHIGVPLTLFNLNDKHECAIIEMGMSNFGEIKYLANTVNPQIGVISNIGLSHIENLGSQEGIFKSKMEITENFGPQNTLIVNGDDKFLGTLKEKNVNYNLKTFGFEKDNTIYCSDYIMNDTDITFKCVIENVEETFFVPTIGKHNIYNAMAGILVGINLGLSIDEIKEGLRNYKATKMRLDIIKNEKLTIINDAYNASPDSMKAALDILGRYKERKVAILGDMFEMGDIAEYGHRLVGSHSIGKTDILITVGENSKFIGHEAIDKGLNENNVYHFSTRDEAINNIDNIIKDNDVVLVKGSRGMKMEEIVQYLNNRN